MKATGLWNSWVECNSDRNRDHQRDSKRGETNAVSRHDVSRFVFAAERNMSFLNHLEVNKTPT